MGAIKSPLWYSYPRETILYMWKQAAGLRSNFVPRAFSLKKWEGRENALGTKLVWKDLEKREVLALSNPLSPLSHVCALVGKTWSVEVVAPVQQVCARTV